MQDIKGKKVTVAGLGRFGGSITVARWLVQQQARVLVTDQATPEALADSVRQLEGLPIEYRLGEHREQDFTGADLVVASPAVPPASPFLQAARGAGVPVTTEVRLFVERCPATIVGVTGTKGKSTVTAMIGEILGRQRPVWVGGNIGVSLLEKLPEMHGQEIVVLELSSFMLEYLAEARWSPHIAVVTMIAPDHLDRHKTFAGYTDAKLNIVRFQKADDYAVINETSDQAEAFIRAAGGKVLLYGLANRKPFDLCILGKHNQLNAQAAFAAAGLLGCSWAEAQAALAEFKGLRHRLELVHEAGGVRYYNDSIATIPEAAVAALESFPPKSVIQIVGGYDKHLSLKALCGALVEQAKAVLCIGDTGRQIAQTIGQPDAVGAAAVYACGDLRAAMDIARRIAAPGDVVLLSTGCASYDQFANFEQRGELFAQLARGEAK